MDGNHYDGNNQKRNVNKRGLKRTLKPEFLLVVSFAARIPWEKFSIFIWHTSANSLMFMFMFLRFGSVKI